MDRLEMDELIRLCRKLRRGVATILLFVSLAVVMPAQVPAPAQRPSPEEPVGNSPSAQPTNSGENTGDTKKISPKEAEELFHSVDRILSFISQDTGFPIKRTVKRRLTSRDEVMAFVQKSMAQDEDAQRLRRSELVLKKFGFLPRDFDMQTFLVGLLREQIAGYYDPRTKTVNLLDWLDAEQQRPVLAHELTHALQDQSFGLKKWMKSKDLSQSRHSPSSSDIQNDEVSSARQAVVEGQATAVLIEYMLAPVGRSIKSSPDLVGAIKEGMLSGSDSSVEMRKAPNFLREALTFPYRYGLDFTVALLNAGGKEKAYAEVFRNPPTSTRQIMEPQTYLSGERIEPMPVPDFNRIFKNYERFDVGAMGEFDVLLLLHEYAGDDTARYFYPQWRGGYYYAARPKNNPSAPLGLLYVSRWSDGERAAEFAAVYARALSKRYQNVRAANKKDPIPPEDFPTLLTLSGRQEWTTEEGPVIIETNHDTVMVTESLDQQTTDRIEEEIFAATAAK